jgi:hypothetical protein
VCGIRLGCIRCTVETLIQDLNRQWPEDIFVQKYWLPVIRPLIDIHEQQWSKAVSDLDPAEEFDFASPTKAAAATGILSLRQSERRSGSERLKQSSVRATPYRTKSPPCIYCEVLPILPTKLSLLPVCITVDRC